jgi:type I restriction enzyme S subunit
VKAGWEVKPLGELTETATGNTPPKSAKENYGTYLRFVKPPELFDGLVFETADGLSELGAAKARIAPKGSVLVSCIGNLGKIGLLTEDAAYNQQINAVKPNPSAFLPEYFFYFCLTDDFKEQLASVAGGTTVPIVNKSRFNSLTIPIPPLEEQKRIVAFLDAAFEGLTRAKENAETNLQNARELFENTELELFHKHTGDVADTKLGDLADFRNGLNFSKNSSGQTIKIVGVGDFQDHFWMPLEQLKTVTIEGNLSAQDMISEGDILAVRSNGNKELIGRVMLAGSIEEPTSFSGFTIRIRLNADRVSPEFVCYFMKTKAMRKLLTAGGDGANISNLNQQLLSDLTLRVPSIERQKKVIKEAKGLRAAFDDLVTSYDTKLTDIADLRQSLLKKAFAGELT